MTGYRVVWTKLQQAIVREATTGSCHQGRKIALALFTTLLLFPIAALAAFDPATSAYSISIAKNRYVAARSELQESKKALAKAKSKRSRAAGAEVTAAAREVTLAQARYDNAQAKFELAKEQNRDCKVSKSPWTRFSFCSGDSVVGGLAVTAQGDSKLVQLDAVDYYLWLGGKVRIPFQLLLSQQANKSNSPGVQNDNNQAALLTPDSGYMVRFPVLWLYQPDSGICAFAHNPYSSSPASSSGAASGHCTIGGDIVAGVKPLTTTSGATKNVVSAAARFGVSFLFPILAQKDSSNQGYLSVGADAVYAYANLPDNAGIFAPPTDASGHVISVNKSYGLGEVQVKFAINGHVSIAGTWIAPFSGVRNIASRAAVTVQSQF